MVIEGENFQCSKNFQLENKSLSSSSPCSLVLPELNLSFKIYDSGSVPYIL